MPSLRSSFSGFRHSFRGRGLFSSFCPVPPAALEFAFGRLRYPVGFFRSPAPKGVPSRPFPILSLSFPGYRPSGVVVIFCFFLFVLPASVSVTLRPVGSPMLFLFPLMDPAGCLWSRGWFFVEPRGSRRWWLYFTCLFPFGGTSRRLVSLLGLWKVGAFLVCSVCLACIFGACRPTHFRSWTLGWCGASHRTVVRACWRKGGWCSLS